MLSTRGVEGVNAGVSFAKHSPAFDPSSRKRCGSGGGADAWGRAARRGKKRRVIRSLAPIE